VVKPKNPVSVINAADVPDPRNPHSWLPLIGDPPGTPGLRILYGVLRPEYRGVANLASDFGWLKLQPVPPPPGTPDALTAARAEVLLPGEADDRFACPDVFLEAHDIERPAAKAVLLAYVTITYPTSRLHVQYEAVREIMQGIVRAHGVAILLVQHAPHRAASAKAPHVHALIGRRITSLGLSTFVPAFCGDKGRDLVVEACAPLRDHLALDAQN
jgi:hypothetical protein